MPLKSGFHKHYTRHFRKKLTYGFHVQRDQNHVYFNVDQC